MLTTYLYNEIAYFAGGEDISRTLMPLRRALLPQYDSILSSWLQQPNENTHSTLIYREVSGCFYHIHILSDKN